METKHTPGPWSVINSTSVFSELGADSGDGMPAHHTDGWTIADCSAGVTLCGDDYVELGFSVQQANAKLIAAAPDLLAAAIKVLSGLNDRIDAAVESRSPTPVFEGIAAMHDAINKATA